MPILKKKRKRKKKRQYLLLKILKSLFKLLKKSITASIFIKFHSFFRILCCLHFFLMYIMLSSTRLQHRNADSLLFLLIEQTDRANSRVKKEKKKGKIWTLIDVIYGINCCLRPTQQLHTKLELQLTEYTVIGGYEAKNSKNSKTFLRIYEILLFFYFTVFI